MLAPKPLLSRVADAAYWMARYIERAENVARIIGVNLHLMLDLASGHTAEWQAVVETTGDRAVFLESYGVATKENVVRFLGIRFDIPELLSTLDVYAMPSKWEGLPIALLEAMAAGCAIVATKVGGIPTAIKHGINGALVPPADPQALAAELEVLLRNEDLRRSYGAAARRSFHPRFSAAEMTRPYESLYLRKTA